eukprot:1612036-Pleurochrysis_carterae.AAC.1
MSATGTRDRLAVAQGEAQRSPLQRAGERVSIRLRELTCCEHGRPAQARARERVLNGPRSRILDSHPSGSCRRSKHRKRHTLRPDPGTHFAFRKMKTRGEEARAMGAKKGEQWQRSNHGKHGIAQARGA